MLLRQLLSSPLFFRKGKLRLADQAEAAYLLASTKLSKTTGQILAVDGGLHEAFLR